MDIDSFFKALQDIAHQDWFANIIIGVVIVLVTLLVARLSSYVFMRLLDKGGSALPKNSIFLNLIRLFVWIIGISILLGVCFNINLSAILTALGVGGIAVSLGFQATLSNLIGGLEVSISKIFVPGDNIQIGNLNLRGIVKDVTWRQTTLIDYSGNEIMVPNSAMNTQSLVLLSPRNYLTIPLSVTAEPANLDELAHTMESAAKEAASKICTVTTDPVVTFSEITDFGFKASMTLVIDDPKKASGAIDACIRAVAAYTRPETHSYS